jgi:hypothetical protein
MNLKPDWYRSRTFWIGIGSGIVWLASMLFGVESASWAQGLTESILPLILLALGTTERKGAASVK